MDVKTIDLIERTLNLLTVAEVEQALWFVEVCEKKGTMRQTEADEWRRRIVARKRFLGMDIDATSVS